MQSFASRGLVLVAIAAVSVTVVRAQAPSKQPVPKLSFRYPDTPQPGCAGPAAKAASRELIVHVELQDGWHINSQAPLDSFLVPTTIEAKAEGLEFGKPEYPKAELRESVAMGGRISLFTGAFDVRVPFVSEAEAFKGGKPPRTKVTLNYQSCNNNMCLPPKSITVER